MQHEITTSLKNDNHNFLLTYYEENEIGTARSVSSTYKRDFDNGLVVSIGATKNLAKDFTESNSIAAKYVSDCLEISLSLAKTFYENSEVKPSNALTFSVVLKPFGSPISPDLSSFVN